VRVSLTAAPLGSPGSLLEVSATTDASECLSVWRYHDGALTRLPIRGVGGRALADCATPRSGGSPSRGDGAAAWTHRWERPAADAPSVLVRERTTEVARGTLRNRETYPFHAVISHQFPLAEIDRAFAECEWAGRDASAVVRGVLVP